MVKGQKDKRRRLYDQLPHLKMILGPSRKRTSQTRSKWSKGSVYAKRVMNQCEQYMVACTPSLSR